VVLSTSQSITFQRIRNSSSSKQAVSLSDDGFRALIFIAARDLGLSASFPEIPPDLPDFFAPALDVDYVAAGDSPLALFERLCALKADADTYVACLASLHKARLKYRRVLATQPFSRMEQVGPRGLLQYGLVDVSVLAALLIWRKWIYDIDNRAAQDTGYLVEPVIAGALGGVSYSSKTSPIKRVSDPRKGRQVDCIKNDLAYEFKIRMTIAASGQGRWSEEIAFAEDVRNSGYTPVLVVLDPTTSTRLVQLKASFEAAGGHCYIGDEAWRHLHDQAQPDMRSFIAKYVEKPLKELFEAFPPGSLLPSMTVHDLGSRIQFEIGNESWTVQRDDADPELGLEDPVLEGGGESLPGLD
jgi:hypothetical protein